MILASLEARDGAVDGSGLSTGRVLREPFLIVGPGNHLGRFD
jgi:hypothetical protein